MAKRNSELTLADNQQTIERLRERHAALHERKIRAETELKNARKALEDLKREALDEYQTDDIDELKRKLQEMKDENERKRSEYQSTLDRIEGDLARVDEEFAGTEAS